jgi:siderophore synthetase component
VNDVSESLSPADAAAHLTPEVWSIVTRALLVKAISEFAHELLIEPQRIGGEGELGHYRVPTDHPEIEYRFHARLLELDHWAIERTTLCKLVAGQDAPLDATAFVLELRERLGIAPSMLAGYLEEVASTLYAAAYKHVHQRLCAAELVHADFQTLEGAMTEGHPIFVANNARIGFNARDYRAHAPEHASPQALVWLAVRRERASFACTRDLTYAALMEQELGPDTLGEFAAQLRARGHDPAGYLLLPVHPWQWENRLAQLFATDLACGDLVHLGRGRDLYQPQQSIRTFFNLSHPHKRYIKTSLSIRNMGFTRGMSAMIGERATAVNDWVRDLVSADPVLAQCGFSVLREVAFLGVPHRHYQRASTRRADGAKEMLAALYRESPLCRLQPGQRLMTMAALLHVDRDGRALLPALIEASGIGIDAWLERYLRAYLVPQLHCFHAHRLVFTPHCENVILVLERHAPVAIIMKDLAEDIGVLNPEQPLPEPVRHIALRVPEEVMTLSIFTDAFDCVFRFLAALLDEHAGYPAPRFFRQVARCIADYQRSQPQLRAAFRRHDLFAPSFTRNCLNRLQLRNHRMMIDLNAADPVTSLQFKGTLQNPIAPHQKEAHGTV